MKIVMTKGDTPSFEFKAYLPDGTEYEFQPTDEVIFAVKQDKYDDEPAFTVKADIDKKTVTLREEDTKNLELGKYVWELSLNTPDGYHCTFIEGRTLKLTVEVA